MQLLQSLFNIAPDALLFSKSWEKLLERSNLIKLENKTWFMRGPNFSVEGEKHSGPMEGQR